MSNLKECADKSGKVTLYTDAKVESLAKEGSAVAGVTGTRPSSGATVNVKAKSVEKGHSFKADDIKGLAGQIKVPADALAETIEGCNACVKAGVDT
ncbi:MAG: hypothetical protein RSB04_07595 [Gordonibacter sp.]|uniref:hypothetical protein n=1 Tax=Gordonibacter sp. TaxID=1968902 RepID=UPI002FC7F290